MVGIDVAANKHIYQISNRRKGGQIDLEKLHYYKSQAKLEKIQCNMERAK